MESALKKYLWLIQLGVVALIAVLAGLTLTNTLNAVVSPLLISAPPAPTLTSSAPQDSDAKRLASLDSDVWQPAPPEPAPQAEPEAETEPETEAEPELSEGEYPISDLGITLTGTTVASTPAWSMALFNDPKNNATLILQEKEPVAEGATLFRIERDRVIIQRNGQLEQIDLESNGKTPPGPRAGAFTRKPTPTPATPTPIKTEPTNLSSKNDKFSDIKKGIAQNADGSYSVDRKVLGDVLTNPEKFRDGTKVRPNYNGGKINGFKLSGLPAGSPLSAIGIQSNDVITAINGTKLDSPNKALELYQKMGNLNSLNKVTVTVERNGKTQNLSYQLK